MSKPEFKLINGNDVTGQQNGSNRQVKPVKTFDTIERVNFQLSDTMTEKNTKNTTPRLINEEADNRRKYRWKRRIKTRATLIKRQLQKENRFHKAMLEMRTTSDHYRRSYLHWIMQQMFSLYDYESGLQAINDKEAYQSWLKNNCIN